MTSDPAIALVEDDSVPLTASLNVAGRQVGVRNRVWPVLGFRGSPDTSIAVIDTGIDVSHPTFAPGYGEGDFAKKVICWRDFSLRGAIVPDDSDGHGTHVSGIAAGVGFSSLDPQGSWMGTDAFRTRVEGATMHWGGFWVTQPGTIEIEVGHHGRFGTIQGVLLYRGNGLAHYSSPGPDREIVGWTLVARLDKPAPSSSTDAFTFSRFTHVVEAGQEGLYHIATVRSRIGGGLAGAIPYDIRVHAPGWPVDESPSLSGIAPGSKLVAIRAENPSDWAAALDFLVQKRRELQVTVVNISQGSRSDSALLHNAVVGADRAGLLVVVAAGNGGPASSQGGNEVTYPARIHEAVAVAAIDAGDEVTSYSSQGGVSAGVVKPDLAAPGGSAALQGGIYSADSSFGHPPGAWGVDLTPADGAPIQGTSQAAPVVAGAAQLVVHALGGWPAVDGSSDPARIMRRVKQLLFATATETFPARRQITPSWPDPAPVSPTFDAGDPSRPAKDPHEGYGRLNADAAVEAALEPVNLVAGPLRIEADLISSGALMGPGGLDLDLLGERRCLARSVRSAGRTVRATLRASSTLKVGLFVYESEAGPLGQPLVLTQSIAQGDGETLSVTFPAKESAPIVTVKALAGRGRIALVVEQE